MISQIELDRFYEHLVATVQTGGGVCAITSGMACVQYGVAASTKDCDVLVTPDSVSLLVDVLKASDFHGVGCRYRGNISPPLDSRWLRGGWTSHFQWPHSETEAHLDVFGVAPRGTVRWELETSGLYAHPHTVAEMKRTNRGKDWPFATALGAKLLAEGDARGWLHVFDEDVLLDFVARRECPPEIRRRRPVLRLAFDRDPRLRFALLAEMQFWHELDRVRMRIYEHAVRPYLVAVRKARLRDQADFSVHHSTRLECAQQHLVVNPLASYPVEKMILEATEACRSFSGDTWMPWLPDVHENFEELSQ